MFFADCSGIRRFEFAYEVSVNINHALGVFMCNF